MFHFLLLDQPEKYKKHLENTEKEQTFLERLQFNRRTMKKFFVENKLYFSNSSKVNLKVGKFYKKRKINHGKIKLLKIKSGCLREIILKRISQKVQNKSEYQ